MGLTMNLCTTLVLRKRLLGIPTVWRSTGVREGERNMNFAKMFLS